MIYRIKFPEDGGSKYELFRYPAREIQVRLCTTELEKISMAKSIEVYASSIDGEIMSLALLTDALHKANEQSVPMTLVLPYLPYSRADRRFVDGDCYALYVFGSMVNNLGYTNVLTLDAHSYHAKNCIANMVNVSSLPLIENVVNLISYMTASRREPTILLPDKGAMRYALKSLGKNVLQCAKKRDPGTGKLSGFTVPPRSSFGTESVLIVDDICDGGGTFIGIADELAGYGFHLYLYVTHGIFSKGFDELKKRFSVIYTSDSFGLRDRLDVQVIPAQYLFDKYSYSEAA